MNDKDNIVELAVVMGTGNCSNIVEYYGCIIREVRRGGGGGEEGRGRGRGGREGGTKRG